MIYYAFYKNGFGNDSQYSALEVEMFLSLLQLA